MKIYTINYTDINVNMCFCVLDYRFGVFAMLMPPRCPNTETFLCLCGVIKDVFLICYKLKCLYFMLFNMSTGLNRVFRVKDISEQDWLQSFVDISYQMNLKTIIWHPWVVLI